MQIVVRQNRVVDYCDEDFISMGSTVVSPKWGDTYEDCTIVTVDSDSVPADIDRVSYLYIAGKFIKNYSVNDPTENKIFRGILSKDKCYLGKPGDAQTPDIQLQRYYYPLWDNLRGKVLPIGDYDITVSIDGSRATDEQKLAYDNAELAGHPTQDIILVLGEVPTIDIPVILKVVKR